MLFRRGTGREDGRRRRTSSLLTPLEVLEALELPVVLKDFKRIKDSLGLEPPRGTSSTSWTSRGL